MVRPSAEPGARDRFTCGQDEWALLLQVAESFGWKPRGTVYEPTRGSSPTSSTVRHDYLAGGERDRKLVEVADAIALAAALSEARRSPHLRAMLSATSDSTGASSGASSVETQEASERFDAVMGEFIDYAFGGAFFFARSD